MFNWLFGDNDKDDDTDKLIIKTDKGNSYTFELVGENEDYIYLRIPEGIKDKKVVGEGTLDFYSEMKDSGYELVKVIYRYRPPIILFKKV